MGALISSLYARCCLRLRRSNNNIRLPDLEEGKVDSSGSTPKRRALLVGISYAKSENWETLEGPHDDVDHFQKLLIDVYKFAPADITILKDDPNLPDLFQPTHANMIRELKRLVSHAAPGDRFVFLYSGHSDQQPSDDSSDIEEDGQDEVIITSDEQRIIDNTLKEILVDPLMLGCSLLAILDSCHSGTMLDLPHHHCNAVYVPWLSKGVRRTATMQNKAEHRCALAFGGSSDSAASRIASSICSVLNSPKLTDRPLQIDTQLSNVPSTSRCAKSRAASILSPTHQRLDSPVSHMLCDGNCGYDVILRANVVSISACSDPQRAWEGPCGSLTTVLCEFLRQRPFPSYRELMTHINFELHSTCRALHEYTRTQKRRRKERIARGDSAGSDFQGELNNFQTPELSSLAKLDMDASMVTHFY